MGLNMIEICYVPASIILNEHQCSILQIYTNKSMCLLRREYTIAATVKMCTLTFKIIQ